MHPLVAGRAEITRDEVIRRKIGRRYPARSADAIDA
jgi:hypothetical protein